MLIILMTSSHSIGLSGLGSESFFNSKLWLPRGWATDGFVVLCGLTVALVWDWTRALREFKESLQRKAIQLLVVMFISNMVLLIIHHLVRHEIAAILNTSWWIGLLTLSTPYSISGVLLPIAACVFMLPYLVKVGNRTGWFVAGSITILLNVFVHATDHLGQLGTVARPVIEFGAGFPIIPMVTEGAIGFSAGMTWRSLVAKDEAEYRTVRKVSFVAMMILPFASSSILGHIASSLAPVGRVLLLILFGLAVSPLPFLSKATEYASLLGRYSLFCFVIHRIVIQSAAVTAQYLQLQPTIVYIGCFALTLMTLGMLCHIRLRHQRFNNVWKKCYL